MKKKKIKVFTAFSGYDSQCMALERLKENYPDLFDYELVGWAEIDEPAIASHNAVFPEAADKNYGDISKIDWSKVEDFDLFTYSSPCFVAGTPVLTKNGYKNIEDIQIGDEVLTHEMMYSKVTETFVKDFVGYLYTIKINDDEIKCTPNHPFYVYNKEDKYDWTCKWVEAKDLDINKHYICGTDKLFASLGNFEGEEDMNLYDIKSINKTELLDSTPIKVYNLEVETYHSYTVFTYFVHNCQDFSICGKQRGGIEGSGTRSSLLWECKKTIEAKRPKFCILENVKALVSDKFLPLLKKWMTTVNEMGYVSSFQVLNSGDYDIPQGRERVFMVSVRKDDEEPNPHYYFPSPKKKTREITDFLLDSVPEEYYLSDEKVPKFLDLLKNTGDDFDEKTTEHQDLVKEKECACEESCTVDKEQELMETVGFVPENALF